MTKMTKSEARERLIDALVEDQIGSYRGDSDGWNQLGSVFREGFKGFQNMSDAELRQCAFDSGVADEHEAEVAALKAA